MHQKSYKITYWITGFLIIDALWCKKYFKLAAGAGEVCLTTSLIVLAV